MRLLSTVLGAFALSIFAFVPAYACSWGKTAQADKNMTVADTMVMPETDTNISVATNDLSDEIVRETLTPPVQDPKPAE